jgi:YhcH/YjgK/YiaL family protein
MIFDNIKNCKMYYGVNPKFEKAFEFIKKAMDEKIETGEYEIDGREIYAIVQTYDSKLKENSFFEGHQNYVDIQCVTEGCEMMGIMEISKCVIKDDYNAEKDVAFYQDSDNASYCIAGQGDFCVFYPNDIHRPGLAINNVPSCIKKIIVKVRV